MGLQDGQRMQAILTHVVLNGIVHTTFQIKYN